MTTIMVFFFTVSFGIIAWAFRLESRVNVAEQRHIDLKELITTRFDAVADRLERIEQVLNGRLTAS